MMTTPPPEATSLPSWNALKTFWMFDDARSYGARAILRWTAEGLRAAGKRVSMAQVDLNAPDAAAQLGRHFEEASPDAVFFANHPPSLFMRQLGIEPSGRVRITWLLDDPRLMGAESFEADEVVLVADPAFVQGAYERGAQRVFYLPVAAPMQVEAVPQAQWQAPLVYVGAAANLEAWRKQLRPAMLEYFHQIVEQKIKEPRRSFDELLEAQPIEPGKRVNLNGPVRYYLYTEANRRYRLAHLEPLAGTGLRLYGNDGWRAELKNTDLEAAYGGPIDPFAAYPHVIASADINLNLRSLQGITAPTHRDFLIPLCGGFLLSTPRLGPDAVEETHAFGFDKFPWAPEASSPEVLRQMALHYQNQPEARREWVQQASAVIREGHTMAHRMQQLASLWDCEIA
mgnify:CR=1 FL=1